MRNIVISKKMLSAEDTFYLMLDGSFAGRVDNDTYILKVDAKPHRICTTIDGHRGNVCEIPEGNKDFVFIAKKNDENESYDLVFCDRAITKEERETLKGKAPESTPTISPESTPTISIVTAVVLTFIVWGVGLGFYGGGLTSGIGLILCLVFSVGGAACMIIGGHWIIIVPLPFFFVWKYGCAKPDQSTKVKVITLILFIVLYVAAFLLMFLFS